MHNQTDYGYAVPQLETRTRELCLRRAAFCEKQAARADLPREGYGGTAWYALQATEWRAEAGRYPDTDAEALQRFRRRVHHSRCDRR